MKVLMVNNLYAPNFRGGAERSVQLLAEALVRQGVEVTVVGTDSQARDPVEVNGVKVATLAPANLHWGFGDSNSSSVQRKLWHLIDVYNPIMHARLVALLQAERPSVVHTNNLQGISIAAWTAARRAGVPILHTLRDYYLACARSTCFRDGRNCTSSCFDCVPFAASRRFASHLAEGVIGTSRFILEHHLNLGFFPRASLRDVIVNPSVAASPKPKSGDALVFGFLGRLEPSKGVDLLIRAFAERTDSSWQLMIGGVGPSPVVEKLRHQAENAKRADQIRFLGWVDTTEFLGQLDVLIVPSLWHEPLSRAALEAQSHGVVTVCSRRGGLPEIVTDDVSGLLFEPDDPDSLTSAIDRLLNDPQLVRRLRDGAIEMSSRYRPDTVAIEYAAAYAKVIANAKRDDAANSASENEGSRTTR